MSHDCNWASWYREYIYQNEVDFGGGMALNQIRESTSLSKAYTSIMGVMDK